MLITEKQIKQIVLEELIREQKIIAEQNFFKNLLFRFLKKPKNVSVDEYAKNLQKNFKIDPDVMNYTKDAYKEINFLINQGVDPKKAWSDIISKEIENMRKQRGFSDDEETQKTPSNKPPPPPPDDDDDEEYKKQQKQKVDDELRAKWAKEREEKVRATWGARPQGFYDDEKLVPKGRIATYKESKFMNIKDDALKQIILEEIRSIKKNKNLSEKEINEIMGIGKLTGAIGQKMDYAKGFIKGSSEPTGPSKRQIAGQVTQIRGEIKKRMADIKKNIETISKTVGDFNDRIENIPGMSVSKPLQGLAADMTGAANKIKFIEKDPSAGVQQAGAAGGAGGSAAGGNEGGGEGEQPGIATRAAQAVGGVIGAGVGAFKQAAGGGTAGAKPPDAAGADGAKPPDAAGATDQQAAQAMKFSDAKKANANLNILTYANSVLAKDPEFAKMFPFQSRMKVQNTILDVAKQLNIKPEDLLAENIKNRFFSKNYNYNKILKEQQSPSVLTPDERKKLFDYLLSKNFIKSDLVDKVKEAVAAPAPAPAPAAAGAAPAPAPAAAAGAAPASARPEATPRDYNKMPDDEKKDFINTFAKGIERDSGSKVNIKDAEKVIKHLLDNNIIALTENKINLNILFEKASKKRKEKRANDPEIQQRAKKHKKDSQTNTKPSTTGSTSTTTPPVGSGMTADNTTTTAVGVSPDNDTGSTTGNVSQQPTEPESTQSASPSDTTQQPENKLKAYAQDLAKQLGMKPETVEEIVNLLKSKFKDTSLINEHLISRRNNSLTNEQIKRMKLLAGIIK